ERSDDGVNFTIAGLVQAAGYSSSDIGYHFHDPVILQEKNYYRLKQMDVDGKYEYSKIILLRNAVKTSESFILLTNPFVNNIDLVSGVDNHGRANFKIFDMNGRLLLSKNVDVVPSMRIRLDLPSIALSSGIYMLNILLNEKQYQFKMVRK